MKKTIITAISLILATSSIAISKPYNAQHNNERIKSQGLKTTPAEYKSMNKNERKQFKNSMSKEEYKTFRNNHNKNNAQKRAKSNKNY